MTTYPIIHGNIGAQLQIGIYSPQNQKNFTYFCGEFFYYKGEPDCRVRKRLRYVYPTLVFFQY